MGGHAEARRGGRGRRYNNILEIAPYYIGNSQQGERIKKGGLLEKENVKKNRERYGKVRWLYYMYMYSVFFFVETL